MPHAESKFYAYETHDHPGMPIVTAPVERDWMDGTEDRFAYRCLPLVLANHAGWMIQCPVDLSVHWTGGPDKRDVHIQIHGPTGDVHIASHFGHGVLTITIPYLFRTPPGIKLWVKGPSNWIKDGIQALEGIVETDWSAAPFTMNWRLTRPNHNVHFQRGEPICMVIPGSRELAERVDPHRLPLHANPELAARYSSWSSTRGGFLKALTAEHSDAVQRGWEKDYFQGRDLGGAQFDQHETRLHLKEFVVPDGATLPRIEFPKLSHDAKANRTAGQSTDSSQSAQMPAQQTHLSEQAQPAQDNSKCVILVPVTHHIEPDCDRSLHELEAKGHSVWRVWGSTAIDEKRSQMATDALAQDYEELIWIDPDITFDPEAIDRLRSHNLPVVCGIYPQKGRHSLACCVLSETKQIYSPMDYYASPVVLA